jgi:hypothetical protein
MRAMNLPEVPIKARSVDDCVCEFLGRLPADEYLSPNTSLLLTAYMAWPNDEPARDSFMATYLARDIEKSVPKNLEDRLAADDCKSGHLARFEEFGGWRAVARELLSSRSMRSRRYSADGS